MNSPRHPMPALFLCALLLLVMNAPAQAGSATWNLNPINGDWNTAANWTPATVPNGPGDIATFAASNQGAISISAATEVSEIVFAPGAAAFTFTASTRAGLTFSGAGITNNSGVTQNFVSTAFEGDISLGVITFSGRSSAGSGTVFTNHDGPRVVFDVGTTVFRDQSSAGNATFINLGGTATGRFGGATNFFGGHGDHGTILVNGAEVAGAFGGSVYVSDGSSVENATLMVNGDPGLEGGSVLFDSGSRGGSPAVELFGSGRMDISLLAFDPKLTVGSIEGNGTIILGDSTLNVGSNDRSTTFDGLITVGDSSDGFGGNLEKSGLGALNLTQANAYTDPNGATVVTSGVLRVANKTGSATGNGPVRVNGGTLSGSGAIEGMVTIGISTGTGAFLAPSGESHRPATLTTQNALRFKADATYNYRVNTKKTKADKVVANGVTIESGAQFSFGVVGNRNKKLPTGQIFVAINNSAATPIRGTFANLPDGSTFTVGNNTFQANYEGGDGNDLILTVVP